MNQGRTLLLRGAIAFLVIVAVGFSAKAAVAQDSAGAVYVLTNQTSNSVMVYARAENGALSFSGNFSTGGNGAGTGADPLGSQGSLVLDRWHRLLFAVNAGSNDVSVFGVDGLQLRLLDRETSGGTMPVSIAVHGNLVYVLNAGGAPNIQGFSFEPFTGRLVQVPGSERPLAGGVGSAPAQVSFSPDGDILMATEKNTNQIDVWTVDDEGLAQNRTVEKSSGATPFGFDFARRDIALVSEAGPSALSSYDVDENGHLELLTGSLIDGQKANCWVVVSRNQRFAFTSNTASGSISSYLISKEGLLTLLNATAGITGPGTAPVDMALSADGRFLYAREAIKGTVHGFRIENNGSLIPVASATGVPTGAQGIAAR